jgi:hypothetical protein
LKPDISIELYFDCAASYREDVLKIEEQCRELVNAGKIGRYEAVGADSLEPLNIKRIEDDIRSLPPQKRGTVVSKRNFALPLSNSKRLNLRNTPVLLARVARNVAYVFPCLLGETYYNVQVGLEHLVKNLPIIEPLTGEMEDDIKERILESFVSYEKGLILKGQEIDTGAGLVDIIFLDKNKKHVLVEVEREASDAALGQILRLCAGYQKKFDIAQNLVRGIIACSRIHEFAKDAAKRAGIEIWLIGQKG